MATDEQRMVWRRASAKYRAANHEKAKAAQRRSYHAHSETYSTYRAEHREERATYEAARWRARTPEERMAYSRASWNRTGRFTRYGVTEEQFLATIEGQDGRCAICRIPFGDDRRVDLPHLDHDHVTNRFRGALCFGCNVLLSRAHDDPAILDAAKEYLLMNAGKVGIE